MTFLMSIKTTLINDKSQQHDFTLRQLAIWTEENFHQFTVGNDG